VDATLHDPARPGATVRYPWKAGLLPLRLASVMATAAAVRREAPDVVHVHYARLGWAGPLTGRPFLVHCHGTDLRGVTPGSSWGRVTGPWLRAAAMVLYATPDLEGWARPFRQDAIFLPNPIPIPEAATERAVASQDLLVGVRLDPIKGPASIAATLAALRAIRPATTITIIGQGSEVQSALDATGGAARLIPPLAPDGMPALMADHRAAIGQMGIGAIGNYELESMAAGLPTVSIFRYPDAYDAPPPVIDEGDPVGTARRLAALLDDEPARLALAAAGKAWVRTHHAPAMVADRLLAIYRELLAR
jgi:glycosyltransferase involved in cell wall biosynthesis